MSKKASYLKRVFAGTALAMLTACSNVPGTDVQTTSTNPTQSSTEASTLIRAKQDFNNLMRFPDQSLTLAISLIEKIRKGQVRIQDLDSDVNIPKPVIKGSLLLSTDRFIKAILSLGQTEDVSTATKCSTIQTQVDAIEELADVPSEVLLGSLPDKTKVYLTLQCRELSKRYRIETLGT